MKKHFGPIYVFVRFAVHLYNCYFAKVVNQKNHNNKNKVGIRNKNTCFSAPYKEEKVGISNENTC